MRGICIIGALRKNQKKDSKGEADLKKNRTIKY
jgi:hypothetical protein